VKLILCMVLLYIGYVLLVWPCMCRLVRLVFLSFLVGLLDVVVIVLVSIDCSAV